MEQLTEFNKIIDDLAYIDVNLEDEDKSLHLLCALPRSFKNFKDTMLYGKEGTITLEEVQEANKTQYKCFICHNPGHFKKDCPERKGNGSGNPSVQIASEEEGYESAEALTLTSWKPEKGWVLDSGCSYHICP